MHIFFPLPNGLPPTPLVVAVVIVLLPLLVAGLVYVAQHRQTAIRFKGTMELEVGTKQSGKRKRRRRRTS